MDILSILGPLWLLTLLAQAVLTMVDFALSYKTKQKLFKNLIICNWGLLILSFKFLPGAWVVKATFAILGSLSLYAYYRSMKFCVNCAYPLTRTIFKTKFCPKCGAELDSRSKDV